MFKWLEGRTKPFYPLWRLCEARAGLLMCGKEGESHLNFCGGHVKLVQACSNARGDEESIFSLVWRCCDARAGLFKY